MNTLGYFDILQPLAQGGMCIIWDAVHREHQVHVALKVMTEELARLPHLRRSFRNEVRSMARLQHANIIEVLDFGEIAPEQSIPPFNLPAYSPYLIMERGDGSLESLRGFLNWNELYPILLSLLDALAHAHARGLLHRDLKPANILWKGNHTRVKITDFGLAHPLESDEIPGLSGEILGTPAFMAPEQFQMQWRDYGPWTDLYALGCTIYALLTGSPPFGSTLPLEGFKAAHSYQPLPPLPKECRLPEGAFRWLQRLLHKEPHRRFSCAADAARSLKQVGPGEALLDELVASIISPNEPTEQGMRCATTPNSGLSMELWGLQSEEDIPSFIQSQEPTPSVEFEPNLAPSSNFLPQVRTDSWSDSWEMEQPSLPPESWRRTFRANLPKISPVKSLELFGMAPTPLVGRDVERDELWEIVKRVQRKGRAHTVVLQGPIGCGKSRLAEWICERVSELGTGHSMRASYTPQRSPFSGLGAMLTRHLQCTALSYHQIIERLQHSFLGRNEDNQLLIHELAGCILPNEASITKSTISSKSSGTPYQALERFLSQRSQQKPVVVWIDDVQWGLDGLGFVSHIMKQQTQSPAPILFLLTAQTEDLAQQPSVTSLLEDLLKETNTYNFEIGSLPPDHHSILVREYLQLHDDLAGQVETITAGNPMFAEELVRDWIQRDWLYRDMSGFQLKPGIHVGLPDNLYEVWRSRIARVLQGLTIEDQMALELAAALGRDVDLEEWQDVCTFAHIPVSTQLIERLMDQRLAYRNLDHTGMGWSFVHNMLLESLKRTAIEGGRWQTLHHHCVQMLRTRMGSGYAERLGHHLIHAGKDEEAFEFLRMGIAERLDAGEYRLAQQSLDDWEDLLERIPWPSHHSHWGEYWMYRCRQARGLGDFEQSLQWASHAKHHAEQHNWARTLTEAHIHLGYYGWRNQGEFEVCWDHMRQSEALAIQHDDPQSLAVCRRYMGDILTYQGQYEEATQQLTMALNDANSIQDFLLMGLACYGLGTISLQQAQFDKALEHFTIASQHFEHSGSHRGIADCLNALGDIARHDGDMDRAETMYHEALQKYRQLGAGNAALIELNLGLVWVEQEEYRKAYTAFSQALQTFLLGGRMLFVGVAKMSLLPCLASMQDWDTWDTYFQEATEILRSKNFTDTDLARVSLMAGHVANNLNEPERARQAYRFSHNQWQALGRTEEANAVKASIETLEPPEFAHPWLYSFSDLEAI